MPDLRITLLTPVEAAELLRLRPATLNNWRSAGRGPKFVRVGGLVRYPRDELECWVRAQLVQPES
jgi:excisionase family DNA binding protein